jgi:hypothetical protein
MISKPILSIPSIIAAGGAAPPTMPETLWAMPARIASGALISVLCTIGAPQ